MKTTYLFMLVMALNCAASNTVEAQTHCRQSLSNYFSSHMSDTIKVKNLLGTMKQVLDDHKSKKLSDDDFSTAFDNASCEVNNVLQPLEQHFFNDPESKGVILDLRK